MDVSEAVDQGPDLLEDDHELDGEPLPPDEDPVHLAKCAECATAVRYRPNVTGTGFFLVDADPDAVFGVGDNGRPVCPNGHGEMAIADDQLKSVPEAFADAQTMLKRAESEAAGYVQGVLPSVFPAFNFESVFKEIVQQAQCVQTLKSEYDAAKSEASDAKKALDKGAELLMRMTLEFERRRKEKPSDLPSDAPDRQPCAWEQKHAGQTCSVCSGSVVAVELERLLGNPSALAPADAVLHADDVDRLLEQQDIEATQDALSAADTFITQNEIATWSLKQRRAAELYADALLDKSSNIPDIVVPERPEVLGKPHVPAAAIDGEAQVCQFCEVVLKPGDDEPYKVTAYIGTDCPGKVVDAPRYPTNKGKKTEAKKIAPQPKPSAKAKAKGKKR